MNSKTILKIFTFLKKNLNLKAKKKKKKKILGLYPNEFLRTTSEGANLSLR